MTARSFVCILTVCATAAGMALLVHPAAACETGPCEVSAQAAPSKPIKLNSYMRKPVATSATRTVKKKRSGEYAQAGRKQPAKQRNAAAAPSPEAAAPAAAAVVAISPAAAQAYASYELARVRVVTPEEVSAVNLTSESIVNITSSDVSPAETGDVQVVSASQLNDIDRKLDSPSAVSLDALTRDLTASPEPKPDNNGWLQQMLLVLGGAFAGVAALVKIVLG